MNEHVLLLADPEGPVGCLVLNSRVPPPVKVNNVVRRGKIESHTPGFEGQYHIGHIVPVLKTGHDIFPLSHRRAAVQHEALPLEYSSQKLGQRVRDLPELGEHKDALPFFMDRFADLAESPELAAFILVECTCPEVLVRVIAELFELHE